MVLIGYWPLNETNGTTAYDHSGRENHGTANGAGPSGTGTTTGPTGTSAYSFDGSDDRVELPDMGLGTSNSFTISQWIYLNSKGGYRSFGRYDGSDDFVQIRFLSSNDNVLWQAGHAGSGNSLKATVPYPNTGKWIHFTAVYRSSDPKFELYKDGALGGTDSGTIDDFSTSTGPWIGARNDSAGFFDGKISETRIYNHALSPQEIQYLYNVGKQGRLTPNRKKS